MPKGQKIVPESGQGWPWDAGMKANPTKEGTIDSFTILGAVFELPGTTYWQYWAHEFGHALGIDHVEDKQSIMHAYNLESNIKLTTDDINALRAVCEEK